MSNRISATEIHDALPEEIQELDLYQKREKIYTRKIQGFFQRIRLFTGWPLLISYFLLPWVQWNGRQSILFDLTTRKFYVFGITFWPQDFFLLALALIISAFALFLFTTLFGRIWCGYTCPQTVWTSIFMWIEQWTEGSRNQRIKLDKKPWSLKKLIKKGSKHFLWGGFSLLTGFTFIAYFSPAQELSYGLINFSLKGWEVFWIFLFSLMTYLNAGWLREQVCIYMCPYARFQSVMFDKNTLIVSYDINRGEPRGSKKSAETGDCIDCKLCVQVCPTGIDIREGLQFECIDCALCIDACNSVMEKVGSKPNLILYTTEQALEHNAKTGEAIHQGLVHTLKKLLFRPSALIYSTAFTAMCLLFSYLLITRIPLALDVIRDRGTLYTEQTTGIIENNYTLRIMNMTENDHRYNITVSGLDDLVIMNNTEVHLSSGEILTYPLRLSIKRTLISSSITPIVFSVLSTDESTLTAKQESRFFGPFE